MNKPQPPLQQRDDDHPDFGIIGHQASWRDIVSIVNNIREDKTNPISEDDIKSIFPYFPPRSMFNIEVTSTYSAEKINGKYIETFISPDSLTTKGNTKENLEKVNQAARVAIRHNIPISALGGFTSIVLEGNIDLLPPDQRSKFTTGNTLTAALIAKGIVEATALLGLDLKKSNVLILGATGDIGSACTHYFKDSVKRLFLVARNYKRLSQLRDELRLSSSEISIHSEAFTPQADIVIAATSSTEMQLSDLKPTVLLVDAGYPKNLRSECLPRTAHLFYGGMGFVRGGYSSTPDYHRHFYCFPYPNIAHGCILEAIVLAFERRHEAFSANRGKITNAKMKEILSLSEKHGIVLAPFYNDKGLWSIQKDKT